MTKYKIFLQLIFIGSLILQVSCSSNNIQKEKAEKKFKFEKFAEDKYKTGYKFLFNDDSLYVLCVKQFNPTPLLPQHKIDFFIFDRNKNKILYEDSIPNGEVKWINNFQVKIVRLPGNIRGDDPEKSNQTLLYDVRLQKLLPFNKSIEQRN